VTICGSQACGCGLISNSLTITGSGAAGSPFQIETTMGQIVTSGTRPGSPINGMTIYETDTGRLVTYDGTNWVIMSGNMPRFKVEQQTAQSVPDNTGTTPALSTEIFDTDAFHTSTNGFVTIPSGMGGDYAIIGHGAWAGNATSYRLVQLLVANNAGAPTQNVLLNSGGYAMTATVNNGFAMPALFRLAAAATVTLRVFQLSGGALNLNSCLLEGWMVRHIPSLV
jgi:hypothetical protein